jgi:hypothetical protein
MAIFIQMMTEQLVSRSDGTWDGELEIEGVAADIVLPESDGPL